MRERECVCCIMPILSLCANVFTLQSPEGCDNELVQILHMGTLAGGDQIAEKVLELKPSQVVSSEKHCLALSGGLVYDLDRFSSPVGVKVHYIPQYSVNKAM